MMKYSIGLEIFFLALAGVSVQAVVPNERKCAGHVEARLPPNFGPPNPKFKYPPPGYFSGLFFQTYSSINDTRLDYVNIQLLSVFELESGITYDLTSYQYGNCNHIYTIFGEHNNTGTRDHEDDYAVVEPGTNVTHIQDVIAYGEDTNCHRYFVLYGKSPGTPGLVVTSSVIHGPSEKTIADIKTALINLGDERISQAAKDIQQNIHDGRRNGLPDFLCGPKCRVNKNSPPADGSCPSADDV